MEDLLISRRKEHISMKALRMLVRAIRDACKSVVRNFPLSLASISCITITLMIVAAALIISYNVQNFTKAIEKDMTIVAFLNNKAGEEEVKQAEKEIDHPSFPSQLEWKIGLPWANTRGILNSSS